MYRPKPKEQGVEFLSAIIAQCSEGVAVSDLDGNLIYLNEAFAKMHGYSSGELIGKHLLVFHTTEQIPTVKRANRQLQNSGVFKGEIWHVKRDGTIFPTTAVRLTLTHLL